MQPKRLNTSALSREVATRAIANDDDPDVVPVPVRFREAFARSSRWLVLDARKLPSRLPRAP